MRRGSSEFSCDINQNLRMMHGYDLLSSGTLSVGMVNSLDLQINQTGIYFQGF